MRKLVNKFALTTFVTLLISGTVLAQGQSEIASVKMPYTHASTSEKVSNTSSRNSAIDTRFSALYPNATDQNWSMSKDNYWVSFQNNSKPSRGCFTKDGNLSYAIAGCSVDQLPESFRKTLSNEYAAYTVFNVIEIKTRDAVAYQVVVENARKYITLKSTADGVTEVQQVNKTK